MSHTHKLHLLYALPQWLILLFRLRLHQLIEAYYTLYDSANDSSSIGLVLLSVSTALARYQLDIFTAPFSS